MKWMSVILAALSLAREVMKYLAEKEANKKERIKHMKSLKDGFKEARSSGDTANIEFALSDMGISLGANRSDKLSDKQYGSG